MIEFRCLHCSLILPVDYALPPKCPQCHSDGWWKAVGTLQPTAPRFTVGDRRFLKWLRIDPGEGEA